MLDLIADSVNPLLALLAIGVAVFLWRGSWRHGLAYTAATALGIAGIYAVQFADARWSIWSSLGGDYSTHTAFATSLVISMAWWVRQLRVGLAVVWALYLALIVVMRYHGVIDVITAAIVAVAVTVPPHSKATATSAR